MNIIIILIWVIKFIPIYYMNYYKDTPFWRLFYSDKSWFFTFTVNQFQDSAGCNLFWRVHSWRGNPFRPVHWGCKSFDSIADGVRACSLSRGWRNTKARLHDFTKARWHDYTKARLHDGTTERLHCHTVHLSGLLLRLISIAKICSYL